MKQRIFLMTIAIAFLFTGLASATCYLNDVQDDKSEYEGYLNVSLVINNETTPYTAEMELTDDTMLFFPNAEIGTVLLNIPADQIASVTDSEGNELAVVTSSGESPFENFSTEISGENISNPVTITFEDTWEGTFPENDDGYPVAVEILNIGENDADSAWVSLGFCEEEDVTDGNVTDGNVTDGNVTDGNVTDGNVTDGNVTDGNVTDGNVTDGNVTDGNVTDGNVTDGNVTDGNVTDGNVTDGNVTEGNLTICYLNVVEDDKSQYEGQLNATVMIDTENSTATLDLTEDTTEMFPNSTVKTILLNVPADQIMNANDSLGNEWTVTDIEEMENPFGFFLTMITTDEDDSNPFGDFLTMITVSDDVENATGPATIYFNDTWNGTLPENEDGYVIATDVQNIGEADDSAWITLGFCEVAEEGVVVPPVEEEAMDNITCYLNNVEDSKSEYEGDLNASLVLDNETAVIEIMNETLETFPNATINTILLNVPGDMIADVTDTHGNWTILDQGEGTVLMKILSNQTEVTSGPITIYFDETWDGTLPTNDAGYNIAVDFRNIGDMEDDSAWVTCSNETAEVMANGVGDNVTSEITDANGQATVDGEIVNTGDISIGESGLNPENIRIPVGASAKWTNDANQTITVECSSSGFQPIEQSETCSRLFRTAGVYEYTVQVGEETYQGTITVGDGGVAAAEETTTEEDMAGDNVTEANVTEANVTETNATEDMTIAETVADNESFSTLLAALEAANLTETLNGEGPFTVFAPTNESFDKLPEGTLDTLLEDEEALTSVLTYHVVSGEYNSTNVSELDNLTTLQGENITISVENETVMINNATVTVVDIEASNGVIHVIDEVLIPPSMEGDMAEDTTEETVDDTEDMTEEETTDEETVDDTEDMTEEETTDEETVDDTEEDMTEEETTDEETVDDTEEDMTEEDTTEDTEEDST